MQTKFNKIKIALPVLSFLVLASCFFLLYREINNNETKREAYIAEFMIEKSKRDSINLLNHSINTINRDKNILETHFVQSSDVVPLLDEIENAASRVKAKAEVTNIDALDKEKKEFYVSLHASGTFEELYKFLTLLENSPYILEFISVKIQKNADAKTTSALWEVNLKAKALTFIQ